MVCKDLPFDPNLRRGGSQGVSVNLCIRKQERDWVFVLEMGPEIEHNFEVLLW